MAYLAEQTYRHIRDDPAKVVYYYDITKEQFQNDLGFQGLTESLLKAAFCAVVAYGMAPYGPYSFSSIKLADLLKSPMHNCATYMYLTWELLGQFGAFQGEAFSLGWDDGAIGNHAQLIVASGRESLLLDPTIGLIVHGPTFERLVSGDKFETFKSFWSRSDITEFNVKVINAVTNGLYRPRDIIYKFDTVEGLLNDYSEGLRAGVQFIDKSGRKIITGSIFSDTFQLESDSETCYGGKSNDVIFFNRGHDFGFGGKGEDTLFGEDGNDRLHGESGNDRLYGQAGSDRLGGGEGNDWIVGNAGADFLTGGAGADTFRFQTISDLGLTSASADLVLDFKSVEKDRLDISSIDACVLSPGNNTFDFIEGSDFTKSGQVRFFHAHGETRIILNTDSALGDFEGLIRLTGVHLLKATDFVL